MQPIVGIVLAGGQGRRYAAVRPGARKLLEPLPDGVPVLVASVQRYVGALDEVIVVLAGGAGDDACAALRGLSCRVIMAGDAALGMGHTLAAGVREAVYRCPDLAGVVIGLGDMPWVATQTIVAVRHALRNGAYIARPRCAGTPGHPVGFSATLAPALSVLQGDVGARELIAQHAASIVWLDGADYGCVADIDLPEDIGRTFAS
jgi:molybdenum cofactor cytidylyltransferase